MRAVKLAEKRTEGRDPYTVVCSRSVAEKRRKRRRVASELQRHKHASPFTVRNTENPVEAIRSIRRDSPPRVHSLSLSSFSVDPFANFVTVNLFLVCL